jgi:hypothetical protein
MGVTMKLRKEEGKAVPPSLAWMKLNMKYNGDDIALLKLAREDRASVLDFEKSPTGQGHTSACGAASEQVDEVTIQKLREQVGTTIMLNPTAAFSDPAIAPGNHSESGIMGSRTS